MSHGIQYSFPLVESVLKLEFRGKAIIETMWVTHNNAVPYLADSIKFNLINDQLSQSY